MVSLKIWFIQGRGGGHEKLIYRRELPKRGGLGQFADLRGSLAKKRRSVFEGRGVIPQCRL